MSAAGDTEGGLYAIVLAAGAATRFGSAKQLVRVWAAPYSITPYRMRWK